MQSAGVVLCHSDNMDTHNVLLMWLDSEIRKPMHSNGKLFHKLACLKAQWPTFQQRGLTEKIQLVWGGIFLKIRVGKISGPCPTSSGTKPYHTLPAFAPC